MAKDNSFTIHERNIKSLNIEVYKSLHDLNPVFMKDIFSLKAHNYHTRKQQLKYPNPRTVTYGLETFGYRATQTWESLPNDTREASDLKQFKNNVSKYCSNICKCNLCKCIKNLGIISIKDWIYIFLLPPLVISDEDVTNTLQILDKLLTNEEGRKNV